MDLLQRCLLFLLGGLALLLVGGSGSSSSQSLHYFYTAVSEPSQGLSQFSTVGFVNDQPFTRYDSIARRYVPLVPWIEKAGKEDPQYWERESRVSQNTESQFRENLATLRKRYNQNNSTGLHILQLMYGCEAGPDGRPRGGNLQYAYDGEDFLCFDKETLTWTAANRQAEISKQKLDPLLANSQYLKSYLEEECVEWLRRYLGYGSETLQRTERPTVKVARKKGFNDWETLICQAYGFYPKEIDITWAKDGEDQRQDTFHGGFLPNSDGTYQTWLSIEVDPKDRGRYHCQVGHDSLMEKLDLVWEEPASNVWLTVGVLVGVFVGVFATLILLVLGVALYIKKHQRRDCKSKSTGSDSGSDSSMNTLISEKKSPDIYPGHEYVPV